MARAKLDEEIDLLLAEAQALLGHGNLAKALECCGSALALAPDDERARSLFETVRSSLAELTVLAERTAAMGPSEPASEQETPPGSPGSASGSTTAAPQVAVPMSQAGVAVGQERLPQKSVDELRELLRERARSFEYDDELLDFEDMRSLYAVREQILPGPEEKRILLLSGLAELGPVWYWLKTETLADLARMLTTGHLYFDEPRAYLNRAELLALVGRQPEIKYLDDVVNRYGYTSQHVCRATRLLAEAGRQAIPVLRELLHDSHEDVQVAAIDALARVGDRDAIPLFRELLDDDDESVRVAAIDALVRVAGREAIPDLQQLLIGYEVGVHAARRLAEVAGREAIPDLRQAVMEEIERGVGYDESVAPILADLAGREAIPDLEAALQHARDYYGVGEPYCEEFEYEQSTQGVRVALAGLRWREGIADLRAMLKDPSWVVCRAAAVRLVEISGREAIPDLRGLVNHVGEVANPAACALADFLGREAIPYLLEASRHYCSPWQPVANTFRRLIALDRETGLAELRTRISPGFMGRGDAARLLAEAAGREAIPDLQALLSDDSPGARSLALNLIASVSGEDGIPWLLEQAQGAAVREWWVAEALIVLDARLYCPVLAWQNRVVELAVPRTL